MFRYKGTEKDAQNFLRQQNEYSELVQSFLTPGLNPKSKDDMGELANKANLEEMVGAVGGDENDVLQAARAFTAGVNLYREIYGRNPSPTHTRIMGANLKYYLDTAQSRQSMEEIAEQVIHEDVTQAATFSKDFSVVPQFMIISALIPLMRICTNFCHGLGSVNAEKITVHELREQVGPNPYDISEGTDISGLYPGGLSNTRRFYPITGVYDGGDDETTYSLTKSYPIAKGRTTVFINKRKVAEDTDGNGYLTLVNGGRYKDDGSSITLKSQTLTYWASEESTVEIVIAGDFTLLNLPVYARVDTDVENHPEFVAETQYRTRSFDLTAESAILRTGMTLIAMLKGIREMKMNIVDIAFQRLLMIMAADMDRKTLDTMMRFAEGEEEASLDVGDYRHKYEQLSIALREAMNRASSTMQRRTDGKSGVRAWIGGDEFKQVFVNMDAPFVNLAATAHNPILANQPHFIGTFGPYQLYYNPDFAVDEALGAGMGDSIAACGTVLGTVTPPIVKRHPVQTDMAHRSTVYEESFSDQPPDAWKYLMKLKLTDLPA